MKKAFTLIELVVAIALLAMVFFFAGTIFKVSINAYRTAGANAEIIQKLRAITDQLNADFKGALWNPRGGIRFDFDKSYVDNKLNYTAADETKNVRSDSIIFFANGDFQSTKQYDYKGKEKTVVGNVACIFYALAGTSTSDPKEKILVRRQTILTADTTLTENYDLDYLGEYCNMQSLADLIADPLFDANDLMERPSINPTNEDDLVMYMAKGVDDFTIQYVGVDTSSKEFNEWRPDDGELGETWLDDFVPKAFKFTFTLYDSKGVVKNGRTFTHIVYLGD